MANNGITWKKKLDAKEISSKYVNDDVMLFAHNEYWRLYSPYVPMDTGTLWESVEITAEHVRHIVPYAAKMYYGDGFNFAKDRHPLACAHWDEVAMQTQKQKFIKSVENYMKRQAQ